MSKKFRDFVKGIRLRPVTSDPSDNIEGSAWINSTVGRFKVYLDSAVRVFVTEDQIQTLSNKTVDVDNNTVSNIELDNLKAGVVITDTGMAGASDANVPSSLAIKTYVDDSVAAHDDASEITYTPTTPGDWVDPDPTTVQEGLDDLASVVTSGATDLSDHILDTTTHGTVGDIVGTSDSQILTNKTIDADTNTISNLVHGDEVDNPSSGVHGVVGDVVGTSDSQTITNKTIDADNNTISNLLHGDEVDDPSSGVHGVVGDIVGTSDSQTLSNKTISSPTITGDISSTIFNIKSGSQAILNSQANTDITGLDFGGFVGGKFTAVVAIDATANLFEIYEVLVVERDADYKLNVVSSGDQSSVEFNITAAGQVQYSSDTYAGFVSGSVKYVRVDFN